MRRLVLLFAIAIIGCMNSGCATVLIRGLNDRNEPYIGTRCDLRCLCPITPDPTNPRKAQLNLLNPLGMAIGAADLPLSAAVDTVLLPYDITQLVK